MWRGDGYLWTRYASFGVFSSNSTAEIHLSMPTGMQSVRALPLFYKFSLYFSLSFYLSLLFFYFFYIFSPYLVPSLLALLTPGFPIFHYSSISLLEETSLLLILSYWWTPPQHLAARLKTNPVCFSSFFLSFSHMLPPPPSFFFSRRVGT